MNSCCDLFQWKKENQCVSARARARGKDAFRRWLFSGKDGQRVKFPSGEQFRLKEKEGTVFGGTVEIGGAVCRIRVVHRVNADSSKLEVRFPDKEFGEKMKESETTLVGYLSIGLDGTAWFHNKKCEEAHHL